MFPHKKTCVAFSYECRQKESILDTFIRWCFVLKSRQRQYSNFLHKQKRESILNNYMSELYACANIEIKNPGASGLPEVLPMPEVNVENVNCQARRLMVIPQKKKKNKKRAGGNAKS